MAEERLAQDGLQVRVEVTGQRELPETAQAALYRIAQEALNNVTRHAGVHTAVIRLSLESPPARLEIEDAGFGLGGMASRAFEIGWELAVQSQPGEGTCIWVEEKAA